MFSNAIVFRLSSELTATAERLEKALQPCAFTSCGPTQTESSGWVSPRGKLNNFLVESVNNQIILKLKTETKSVPAAVVAKKVDERIERFKEETGRDRVGTKIKNEFKEEALFELLPNAFPKESVNLVWIDVKNKFLIVDAASLAGADKVVSHLIEALSSIDGVLENLIIRPVQTISSPSSAMAHWLFNREAPDDFTVDRDCELKSPDESKSAVRYVNHTLEIDEVAGHIQAGKVPTKLALTWNERVSFVLGDLGQIGKIRLLDVVAGDKLESDKADDAFDVDVAIVTGELSSLIPDLINALGGESQEV